jgi:hypothetical protein
VLCCCRPSDTFCCCRFTAPEINPLIHYACAAMPPPTTLSTVPATEELEVKNSPPYISHAFPEYCYEHSTLVRTNIFPISVDCHDSHHQHRYVHISGPYTKQLTIILGSAMSQSDPRWPYSTVGNSPDTIDSLPTRTVPESTASCTIDGIKVETNTCKGTQ